jgi:hypothetical protein
MTGVTDATQEFGNSPDNLRYPCVILQLSDVKSDNILFAVGADTGSFSFFEVLDYILS